MRFTVTAAGSLLLLVIASLESAKGQSAAIEPSNIYAGGSPPVAQQQYVQPPVQQQSPPLVQNQQQQQQQQQQPPSGQQGVPIPMPPSVPQGQGQQQQLEARQQQNVPVVQVQHQQPPPLQQNQPPSPAAVQGGAGSPHQYQYVKPQQQQQADQQGGVPQQAVLSGPGGDHVAAAIHQAQQIIAQQQAAAAAAANQQQQAVYAAAAAQQHTQQPGQAYVYNGPQQKMAGQPLQAVPGGVPTYTYMVGSHVYDIPRNYEVKQVPNIPGQYAVPHQSGQPKPKAYAQGFDLPDEELRKLHAPDSKYNAAAPSTVHAQSAHDNHTESLAAEWERLMTDFLPDMIVTFKLAGASQEHFQQDVGPEPVLLRGGFFESADESASSIAFQIVSPSGKIAYKSNKGEGLFRIMTAEQGTYTFAVSNTGWTGHKYVTFVVGAGVEKQLTTQDVDSLDGSIRKLYRMLSDIETQNSYLWLRQRSRLEENKRTAHQTYYAFIVQLAATGIATLFQLSVIKRMVSHRRMF